MQAPRATQVWSDGSAYERYIGRWSRSVAREFLAWLATPPGKSWLDLGCGTGAITQMILDLTEPGEVLGIEPSEAFIGHAIAQVKDARAHFIRGDAQAIPVEDATCDVVIAGLVLNFVPKVEVAVAEMARVARPGGVVAAYVWDYAGEMQLVRYFWDAALALNPDLELEEGKRFPMCKPEPLRQLFKGAGLEEVEVRAIDVPTHFKNFDDYWLPFLGGVGPAPRYAVSLGEEERTELRERIRASLPTEADGSIKLIARAWAVRGGVKLTV